jgi:NADH-quinone oxidoreductase subunit E
MVIDEAMRERIDAIAARYPERRGGLLPALHLVQREAGAVSHDAMRELAELFEIRPNEVLEVVSFYNLFDTEERGRHRVNVCINLPCSLRGARGLLRSLEEHLEIRAGETTADGRITLGHEECLGACGYAPMLRVGDTYHEDLDADAARRIVDGLE